ncbi:MAG TPA: hypothetical protein VFI73_08495 [Candidatus Nitrosopolaris sp.]|nr:hypothetical protein [Candidatus Nitrosopolaris sp.]
MKLKHRTSIASALTPVVIGVIMSAMTTTTTTTHALAQTNNNTQSAISITKLLANNLENHLKKAGAILNVTSKLPQVRSVPYANLLN